MTNQEQRQVFNQTRPDPELEGMFNNRFGASGDKEMNKLLQSKMK